MAKAVNGKSKGNSFERKISNRLSERFSTFLGIEKAFIRNADSGSFFGASNMSRMKTHNLEFATFGDIITPKLFNYSIECKHYKTGPSFKKFLSGTVQEWDTWLKQAKQDAKNSKKEMMLIVKYNGVDELVFVEKEQASLKCLFLYKKYYVYTLEDYLTLADTHFFAQGVPVPLELISVSENT